MALKGPDDVLGRVTTVHVGGHNLEGHAPVLNNAMLVLCACHVVEDLEVGPELLASEAGYG